jgi:hypothetical protein
VTEPTIPALLAAARDGAAAEIDELVPLVYEELRPMVMMASRRLE